MSNLQKIPLSRTVPLFARKVAIGEILRRGQALPGTVTAIVGALVTVSLSVPDAELPLVTLPVAQSQYVRLPIQVGDKGVAFPASLYLGQATGMGSGSPAAGTLQPNLATLVWFPVAQAGWASVGQSTVLEDATGVSKLTLAPTGVTLNTVTIDTTGHLIAASLKASNGASGTFTSQDGKTVTVVSGVITSIV